MIEQQIYEVQIDVKSADGDAFEGTQYHVEHRMMSLPGLETLVGLKEEAVRVFEALFPEDSVGAVLVSIVYLDADERRPPDDDRERVGP